MKKHLLFLISFSFLFASIHSDLIDDVAELAAQPDVANFEMPEFNWIHKKINCPEAFQKFIETLHSINNSKRKDQILRDIKNNKKNIDVVRKYIDRINLLYPTIAAVFSRYFCITVHSIETDNRNTPAKNQYHGSLALFLYFLHECRFNTNKALIADNLYHWILNNIEEKKLKDSYGTVLIRTPTINGEFNIQPPYDISLFEQAYQRALTYYETHPFHQPGIDEIEEPQGNTFEKDNVSFLNNDGHNEASSKVSLSLSSLLSPEVLAGSGTMAALGSYYLYESAEKNTSKRRNALHQWILDNPKKCLAITGVSASVIAHFLKNKE